MESPAKRHLVGKTLRVSQKRKSQDIQVKDGSNILHFQDIIIIQTTTIQLRTVLMKSKMTLEHTSLVPMSRTIYLGQGKFSYIDF